MTPPDSQVTHLLELLEPLGGVTARSMFGEWGFFREGAMLACIYKKAFYVRVDEQTRALHEARGLAPFVYQHKTGRRVAMPYYQVPPEAFDDPDEMRRWAEPAARAAAAAKKQTKKKTTRSAKKPSPKLVTKKPATKPLPKETAKRPPKRPTKARSPSR
jgi:DNA transformation protein